jgi:hypothetical protein
LAFQDLLMAWNYFFKDRSGAQNGPVTLDELVALAKAGRVAPDCLVWGEGGDPMRADKYLALAEVFAQRAQAPAAGGTGPLQPSFPVFGLFWRSIVLAIGTALVIPAPWVGLWFYRWLAEQIALPGGSRLSLTSSVGECWWIFAGIGLSELIDPAFRGSQAHSLASIFALFLNVWLTLRLIAWFCGALRAESGGLSISFLGGFWPYFGWIALLILSFATIVGWAWVLKYQNRWICSNIAGTHAFEFVATGFDILWRSLVLILGFAFILPIPWALCWFFNWYVSQFVVRPRAASAAVAQPMAA